MAGVKMPVRGRRSPIERLSALPSVMGRVENPKRLERLAKKPLQLDLGDIANPPLEKTTSGG